MLVLQRERKHLIQSFAEDIWRNDGGSRPGEDLGREHEDEPDLEMSWSVREVVKERDGEDPGARRRSTGWYDFGESDASAVMQVSVQIDCVSMLDMSSWYGEKGTSVHSACWRLACRGLRWVGKAGLVPNPQTYPIPSSYS